MRRIATAVAAGGAVSAAAFYYVTAPQDAPTAPPKQFERVPSRAHHLQTIQKSSRDNPFDILIVGGGATGTGCALDAATRGLKTLLVEQEDFAAGTSSRSTKLVHGGVRYLERAVFGLDVGQLMLVFEALHERRTVLQLAPHLAKELPILTPCYLWWEVPFYWAGLKLYDLVAGASNLTWSRYVSAAESKKQFPSLAPARADGRTLKGTIRYHDGQFDDSRMAVMVACTAAQHGATVLNHMRCESLVKDEAGKVVGAVVWDQLTGRSQPVYARVVINATGPFTDELRRMSRQDAKGVVLPSAGVHVSLPSYYSPDACGLIVPSTKDGRVVFMLPWKGYTIAGTTDSKSDIGMLPRPTKQEVQFILEAISGFLNLQVRLDDVQSAWSGIRPLALDPSASSTAATSRDHVIVDEGDGMLTVTGGKWTTYRHMAEQAVDRAVAAAGMQHAGTCCTRGVPILGGDAFRPDMFIAVAQSYKVPHRPGYINIDIAHHLCESYGDQAFDITRLAEQRGLGRRLIPWHDVLEAEVVHAAQNEYCETAVDFLARRCRLAFIDVKAASMALPRVIELMAAELGWSRSRRAQEKAQALAFLDTFSAASD